MQRKLDGKESAKSTKGDGESRPTEETVYSSDCIVFRVPLEKRIIRSQNLYGGLAQLGERLPCKQEVSGSNPLISIPWVASSVG